MTDKMICPFCGAELRQYAADFWCKNPDCIIFNDIIHNKVIITDLIAGKKAQDALNKIIAIKESVEGCCAEIQQNCLPLLFSIDRDMKLKIDKEVSAIDKYMSEIDEIASITTGENKE